ncbi:hypothetical protein MACH26_25360 [Planctobacterium marinum]|uniref:Cyanophycinase n=2 Tax=Planctobacterium marinum TaxID=1631968 RepID=A0AA48HYM5_9ALTE|nr:hypothetical protein MACH26_25360 [Planctobacterium marinum]
MTLLASSVANACITQETESNDTESSANDGICSGVLIQADIDSRRDTDWYRFDAVTDGTVSITLDHNSRDDFDWDLYRSTGSAVASGATSSVPESGSYAGTAGEYLLKVSRYRGTGWYDLTIDFPDDGSGGGDGGDGGDNGGGTGDCQYTARPSKPGGLKAYIVGNDTDVCIAEPAQAGVLLMGGGPDVDASFSQRVNPHIAGGDVVVLRTSGTDAYNDYLLPLTGADSVETIIVDSVSRANSDYVEWAIQTAEFVFIAGGDQSDYLNQWQGTKVQSALQHVYAKNGIIGGTSAGNAVQGEYIYDPDGVLGAISEEAVTDLCHETINISTNFLNTQLLAGVITDTHFAERDRMGRMATFLANIGMGNRAIGVDENAALYVTEDGNGVLDGTGNAYVLATDSQTNFTQASCGQAVVLDNLLNYQLQPGDTYNVLTGASSVTPQRLDIDGRNSNFYNPSNPY